MNEIVSYITKFLIGGKNVEFLKSQIGYTANSQEFHKYRVVIIPASSMCSTKAQMEDHMPSLPLFEIDGVPLLFGIPKKEWVGPTLIIYADIIAGSFFLLSRYEEIRRRDVRDEHGRFPGKESLPFKAGFIHRPIVDEYGKLLRGWLRDAGMDVAEPDTGIRKIWLTHDVDTPFYCRSFRNVIRETIKGSGFTKAWELYKSPLDKDPYYTFPWLIEQDREVISALGKRCAKSLFFIKGGGRSKQDKPVYKLHSSYVKTLLDLLLSQGVTIGIHSSYSAGKKPSLIASEKERLQLASKQKIRYNRHHYLSLREPEDYLWLERAGITDDFTMGYPDVAGFRLGTSRPVKFINPVTKRVSSLTLHPLTIMDVALSEPQYMGLDYEQALDYCLKLFDQVKQFGGELSLLWHNDIVTAPGKAAGKAQWHRKLYTALITELAKQ